ncbi:MAG: VWA domain-containing protein [Acidobacteria bacterium]|nr:VWA domain-containing protein [Acidobacteriota bacterium]
MSNCPSTATLCVPFAISVLLVLLGLGGASPPSSANLQHKKSSAAPSQEKPKTETDKPSREQDDAIRLNTDLVVVNVTVTDAAGKYAHGLQAKSFAVTEDGIAQTINSFAAEEAPFAAAILFDMSGSMNYKFSLVRAAAATFVEQIRDNDQVAVWGFNNKVKQFQDFSNVRDITDYIWDAEAKETTRMYDCLKEALEALAARPEKRRAILLISDGCDTASQKASFEAVMKKALTAGVTIYTVDLIDNGELTGSSSDTLLLQRGRGEMKEFASQSGGRYVHSPKGDDLQEAFSNIIDELHNQYTLTYYTSNDKHDGRYRKITVTMADAKLTARARRGYYAAKK